MKFWKAIAGLAFVAAVLAALMGNWWTALSDLAMIGLVWVIIDSERTANMLRDEIKTLRQQTASWQRGYFDGMRVALGSPKFAAHKIKTEDSDNEG